MARLSKFVRTGLSLSAGQAVTVGPEGDTFTLTTLGMTAEYADRLWALRREAAMELNRKLTPGSVPYSAGQLPPSADDRCVAQALSEKCLTGISGLQGDDGKEITLPEFNELLLHRENAALLVLAIQAAQIVGVDTQTVQAEAEKNSETPSTGS
ncbi:MAG: hypothetical protein ABF839_06850 [Acetobacter orientalis]|uniref:hypothetical protein n=1 Tax=Acetobacter orientalis TaxID=146474 RepID=UPI0039EC3EBD